MHKQAKTYLGWLQDKMKIQNIKYKLKKKQKKNFKYMKATYVRYLEGSAQRV